MSGFNFHLKSFYWFSVFVKKSIFSSTISLPGWTKKTHRHTDIQTYRHTDTQTYRHTDIQTHRHTDTQTHRHTDIQTYRYTDTQTHIHTDIQTHRLKSKFLVFILSFTLSE
jgi:hypothetical protein